MYLKGWALNLLWRVYLNLASYEMKGCHSYFDISLLMVVKYLRMKNKTEGINYCAVLSSCGTGQLPEFHSMHCPSQHAALWLKVTDFSFHDTLKMSRNGEQGSGTWLCSVWDKVVSRFLNNYIALDRKSHDSEAWIPCSSVYPVSLLLKFLEFELSKKIVGVYNRGKFLSRHYNFILGIIDVGFFKEVGWKCNLLKIKIRRSSWKQEMEILYVGKT